MRNRHLFWITLFLVGVLGYMHGEHIGGDVHWRNNLAAAQREAARSGRYLLLDFSSPDCGWCAKMDADTFSDPSVVRLSQHFVCVRLDSDVNTAPIARYRVMAYPTLIVADAAGHPLYRLEGYVPPEKLAPLLKALAPHSGHRLLENIPFLSAPSK